MNAQAQNEATKYGATPEEQIANLKRRVEAREAERIAFEKQLAARMIAKAKEEGHVRRHPLPPNKSHNGLMQYHEATEVVLWELGERGEQTIKQIAALLKRSEKTINAVMQKMEMQGRVVKRKRLVPTKHGKCMENVYRLPDGDAQ